MADVERLHIAHIQREMSELLGALIVITLMGYNPNKKLVINLRLKKNWIGPVTYAIAARLQNQEHNLELLAALSYLKMWCIGGIRVGCKIYNDRIAGRQVVFSAGLLVSGHSDKQKNFAAKTD